VTGIEPALSASEFTDFARNMHRDQHIREFTSDRETPLITEVNGPLMARLECWWGPRPLGYHSRHACGRRRSVGRLVRVAVRGYHRPGAIPGVAVTARQSASRRSDPA
jgi:hypothetical protein